MELASPPQSANADHDVLDVVLTDLIENEDFDPATGGRGMAKRQVVFGDTTKVGWGGVGVSLDAWIREKKISLEVKDDLLSRNPQRKRYFLARYQPSNPNILVRDLSQIDRDVGFCSQFPDARGYVESYLPGYSRDGRTALVSFSFGPTPHGAVGYYLLSKVKGRWEIIERLIGYFD